MLFQLLKCVIPIKCFSSHKAYGFISPLLRYPQEATYTATALKLHLNGNTLTRVFCFM